MATSNTTEQTQTAAEQPRPLDRAPFDEPDPNRSGPSAVDLTGRDRITRNVLASWAGHGVFIIAGFIMPRMIDGHLGQETLGVWDFGWSLVAYFSLVQGGVVASVNRYVAKFRAAGDTEGINRAVSSVACVLLVMGLVVVGLAIGASLLLPAVFRSRLGGHLVDAQWVVLLLGLSLAVQMASSGFGGVLTGCHRWDLHNALLAGSHAVKVGSMVAVLLLGGGLPHLAAVYLCGEVLCRAAECVAAYRVLPSLRVRASLARWSTARNMLTFGGKAFVPRIAELLANQTTAILIALFLGPAALALFSRPRSLVRHIRTIVSKFAMVLIPTASALKASAETRDLADLLVRGTKGGAFIALPPALILAVLGAPLLHAWMGPDYADGLLVGALALGYLTFVVHLPTIYVLTGLNLHGRPALANLLASLCGVGLTALALGPLKWGLVGAAIAIAVPLTVVNGVFVPLYACRRVGVPTRRYLVSAFRDPALCALPFCLILIGARVIFEGSPLTALTVGCASGLGVLLPLYWRLALPSRLKMKLSQKLRRFSRPDAQEGPASLP